MAEVMTAERGNQKASRKKQIHVDMTPMVDLGFLLITFFMFVTSFSKPNVMDLGLPAKSPPDLGNVIDFRNQITFILGENNRVFYYQKEMKDLIPSDLKETTMGGMEISKLISSYKKAAPKPEIFTIIIKPTDDANYKNFVDILDNMAITNSERYGISEIKPSEKKIYREVVK